MTQTAHTTLPSPPARPSSTAAIVITPLFPRRAPVAAYLTLDEALPRGLRSPRPSDAGQRARTRRREPARRARAALRRRGARRRQAEPHPQRHRPRRGERRRSPIPVSCVEQGRWSRALRRFDAAGTSRTPSCAAARRRRSPRAARPRDRAERGVGRGRDKAARMERRLADRAHADTFARAPRAPRRARAALPARARPVRRRPRARRHPLPRLGLAPRGVRAALAEAPAGLPPRRARASRRPPAPPSAHRGVRRRGHDRAARRASPRPASATTSACAATGVIGSGLELDGELLQLSAFTSDGGADRAFGRIARPSRRR